MINIGPASELSAVNEMLAAIGEDPVESLDNLPPSGNTALHTLQTTARDFQEEGFWFNREEAYDLSPDEDGYVFLPLNALSVSPDESRYVERGDRLYDREEQTFQHELEITCEVVLHLPWNELPSAARRYITALATEKFVDGFPGANAVTEARHRNLLRAKVAFERAVIRNEGLNMMNNTTIQQLTRRS